MRHPAAGAARCENLEQFAIGNNGFAFLFSIATPWCLLRLIWTRYVPSMRAKRLLAIGFCAVAAAAVLTATCGVLRAQESTPAQRRACRPDVFRLCKMYIPSHAGITYCLQLNIDRLSPACRAVMEGRFR
jgi:hypothetical protein